MQEAHENSRSSSTVLRWSIFGILLLVGSYFTFGIFQRGEPIIAACFLAVWLIALFIYFNSRGYTYRYLFPGLLAFGVFVIFPLLYTVYIAFTNYSSKNLRSLDDVQKILLEETYSTADTVYLFSLFAEGDDQYRLILEEKGNTTNRFATEPFSFPAIDPDTKDQRKATLTLPVTEWERTPDRKKALGLRELIPLRNSLRTLEITFPDELEVVFFDFQSFRAKKPAYAPGEEAYSLVDQRTGALYTPDMETGFYRNAQGETIGVGFRIQVGFANFLRIITDPGIKGPFIRIFIWNIAFAALSVFFTFAIGAFLAVLLEWKVLPGRKLYRTLLILPYAVPAFISILIFKGLFNQNFGEINNFLAYVSNSVNQFLGLFGDFSIGTFQPLWNTDPLTAKIMILIVNTWLGYPYMMTICTGILQSVPQDMYEASAIAGARPISNFFRITLPLILPPLAPLLVASFAFNFNNFLLIYLLTDGRPYMTDTTITAGETDLLVTYTFRVAFRDSGTNFGYASAIATLLFIIVGALAYTNLRMTQRKQPIV